MLVKGIDLPEELLRAQAAGELVVFAGAGISNPAPSSLPLFKGLAEIIGRNAGMTNDGGDPEDRFLGKLKQKDIRVHQAATAILVNDHTQPHDLHRLLLQLFPSADNVRIVTTNFDTHFTTAVNDVFKSKVETFSAPALPLGDDFTGLVYLHGCAAKDPVKCVLTDEDFGRAYLTQAWASRFLASMFSRYVVLFVGYSHDDTVMNYLARGLPPVSQKQRFAFTTDDTLQKWQFLGIRPLVYKKSPGENAHQVITDSVREWVSELQRGLLEKSSRIQAITEGQPPLEGEDADYIKHSLYDIHTTGIFLKFAKTPDWISWLEKHDFLRPVFDPKAKIDQIHNEIAFWLVETFLTEKNSQEILAAVERHGSVLNKEFCWWIWRRLCTRKQKPIDSKVFLQWVVILSAQPQDSLALERWAMLLKECEFPNDKEAAILLLERVSKPRIKLKKSWRFLNENEAIQDKVEFELDNGGNLDEHWIIDSLKERILPNLTLCPYEIELVIVSNLTAAQRLMSLSSPLNRNHDPLSFHRQSIRSHPQNSHENISDVLIDVARGLLDHYIVANPAYASVRIEQWFDSDIPILRRLSIYGNAQRTDITADQKLIWIEQSNLLLLFKADVFWLIEKSYPYASEEGRRRFLELALVGRSEIDGVKFDEETIEYQIFNLVVWLGRIAPDCEMTRQKLSELKKKNPNLSEREFPELGRWSSGVHGVDRSEGLELSEIEQKGPSVLLDELLSWKPRHPLDRDRSGYCNAISSLVAKNPEWGIEWLKVLLNRKLYDSDLWNCVCRGWSNANLAPEQWKLILDFAETANVPNEFLSSFADVLDRGSRRETFVLPDKLMEQAHRVAVRIWELALASSPVSENVFKDWLTTAINDAGGKLAGFWLQRISAARKVAGESWRELPPGISKEISAIIQGTSGAAASARVLFASQFHYLFSLDRSFALVQILPPF